LEKIRETKSGTAAQESARVSMTDPEARIMKQSDGGFAPSYNVQLSTDAANKIIVGAAVSQSGSDYTEWVGAVKRVEENLQAKEIYRQRGAIAEFPSAWLKDQLGLRQFRLRGLAKVLLEVPMTDDESRTKTKRTKDQGPGKSGVRRRRFLL